MALIAEVLCGVERDFASPLQGNSENILLIRQNSNGATGVGEMDREPVQVCTRTATLL